MHHDRKFGPLLSGKSSPTPRFGWEHSAAKMIAIHRRSALGVLRRCEPPISRTISRSQRSGNVGETTVKEPVKGAGLKPSEGTKPPSSDYTAPISFCVGSLAGFCGSLVGMGGGFVMIPLMTSKNLLRLSQHQAHGTSLFAVTTTGLAGALGYSGQVDYEAAAAIAFAGMFTARLGAMSTSMISGNMLKRGMGVLMLCVAPLVPAKKYLLEATASSQEEGDDNVTKERTLKERFVIPAMIGCGSGFLAGVFGVGGGAIVVPALSLLTGMNHYQALGTSLCAMSFPAMAGTVTHYGKGNVAMRVAPALAVGAFVGGYVGGNLGRHIDESKLQYAFGCLMIFLGVKSFL